MHSSPAPITPASPRASPALRRDAAQAIAGTALLLLTMALLIVWATALDVWFAAKALGLFAAASACIWHGLGAHAPQTRLGAANGVTLLRLALITLLAASLGEPLAATANLRWAALCLATLAAVLDAVDGAMARRHQLASAFGARFDMETDALLILVLSALVLSLGQAGAWVLAAGALRYAFVLAALPWPWLAAPLPASTRRKTVCVVQIVTLIVCLAPIIAPEWARWIAGAGLAALVYSFAVDTVWLARRRPPAMETAP